MDSQGNDVTHDGLSPEKRPVSPRYVIPFGRVPVAGDTEPPDNETMVGRESERAHFIDMLVSRGATGAYLITGRRGAGKSNFVRHCLNEYNNSVFKRFLRNNSGKSFWDLLGLMIFTGFLIVAALLLTDFLKIETQINLPSQGQGRNGLLLVLAIPTTILCLYPILYTRQVFEVLLRVLRTGGKDRRPNRSASPFAAMITVSLSVICWFLMPPAPMIMVAIYFSMLCLLYAVVQIFSYGSDKSSTDVYGCSEKGNFISLRGILMKYTSKKNVFWRAKWLLFAVYCLIPLMVFRYYGDSIDQVINSSENSYSRLSVWFIIMMNGFFFLSCGFLARARHLNKRLHRALVGKAFRNSSAWYFAGSVLLFPVLSIGLYLSPLGNNVKTTDIIGIFKNYYFQGLAVCCLIYLFFALEWIISRRKEKRPDVDPTAPGATGPHFRPQPALLLAFKGVGGIILGIQLAYPAISFSKELIFYHFLMDATASRTLFNDNQEEILWAFSVFFTLCAIYYMEYEWILRPLVVARDESSLDPAKRSPWEDQKSRHTTSPQRFQFRQMARLTFPWSACTIWLPTLTVTVNLGFEEMDHKRVVHAMLAGLRTEYHRLFLAWHSSVANIIRFISLLLLMVLVAQIGRAWFELPPISKIEKRIAEIGKGPVWNPAVSSSACEIYEKALKGYKDQNLLPALNYIGIYSLEMRPGLRFSCSLPMRDMVISTLYFDILSIPGIQGFEESSRLLLLFTDANWPLLGSGPERTISLRGYHLFLFIVLFQAGRWLIFWLPLLPFRRNLKRIDDLLDALSSKTVSRKGSSWGIKVPRWAQMDVGGTLTSEVSRDPTDSRIIELACLDILKDIQNSSVAFLRGSTQRFSIPAPEITFVFDELDKLGLRVDQDQPTVTGPKQDIDLLDAERKRSLELHRLLSDLKRLLSAAPARFIFVGGRMLHDEWLADLSNRQPLLTSIFNTQIHLPSLLADHSLSHLMQAPHQPKIELHDRIRDYLSIQHYRAARYMKAWLIARWHPSFALGMRWEQTESFFQPDNPHKYQDQIDEMYRGVRVLTQLQGKPLASRSDVVQSEVKTEQENEFLDNFLEFLAYRSAGTPKRLNELLLSFVEPVGRVVPHQIRWSETELSCTDVLYFSDNDIYRIQLISSIYRHLMDRFESRLLQRDEKVIVSLFYLTDFLLKFHRRAFAWSNLERLDELIHIHRAPDLRRLMEDLVEQFSEKFLHPMLNGMYAYRFRSEIAIEVEYLSRRSKEDLAAFNFTLDESQALKRIYSAGVRGAEESNIVIISGLGELYEYDQEYETARQHYRKAIELADRELERLFPQPMKMSVDGQEVQLSAVAGVLFGLPVARKAMVLAMSWGVTRLRLMLQVGMTFELARNLERAEAEYRGAHALAERLIDAFIEQQRSPPSKKNGLQLDAAFDAVHPLKHLGLIYQPIFAVAWVAEKLIGNIDTSIAIVERYLHSLRRRLPFIGVGVESFAEMLARPHANIALVAAELHRKAADLCFLKGRQFVPLGQIATYVAAELERSNDAAIPGAEGYLLRAHYHYAVAIHDIRSYVQSRLVRSARRFQLVRDRRQTFLPGSFPNYIHLAIANSLNDLADSVLSRVSLFGLLRGMRTQREGGQTDMINLSPEDSDFAVVFQRWFEEGLDLSCSEDCQMTGQDRDECIRKEAALLPKFQIVERLGSGDANAPLLHLGNLFGWIGIWRAGSAGAGKSRRDDPDFLVSFTDSDVDSATERLMMALRMSTLSARYFESGGFPDEAARRYKQCAETVAVVYWWIVGLQREAMLDVNFPGIPELRDDIAALPKAETPASQGSPFGIAYLKHMLTLAVDALQDAARTFGSARQHKERRQPHKNAFLEDGVIPPSLLTLACSLRIAGSQFLGCGDQSVQALDRQILRMGGRIDEGKELTNRDVADLLREAIERQRYPLLNRLNALNTLINAELLVLADDRDQQFTQLRQADVYAREWITLNDRFNAPLHFTPFTSGVTLTWLARARKRAVAAGFRDVMLELSRNQVDVETDAKCDRISYHDEAKRHLAKGRETCSMGRTYYDVIANLYYLYDDFNDRHIHFHHALQMAGSELTTVLEAYALAPEAKSHGTGSTAFMADSTPCPALA